MYAGSSLAGVVAAVAAGLGVACLAQRLVRESGLALLDAGAPSLRGYSGGVLVRDGLQRADVDQIAAELARAFAAGED